jgi:hypothetical protein
MNMDHMKHLETIAAADVAELRHKEATYRGSWKKRGGIGAWMMIARKIDRLENMLNRETRIVNRSRAGLPNVTVERCDVFGAIEADPSGADGSPLAEIRDLRRYLTLAEAEMVARGAVRLETRVEGLEILREGSVSGRIASETPSVEEMPRSRFAGEAALREQDAPPPDYVLVPEGRTCVGCPSHEEWEGASGRRWCCGKTRKCAWGILERPGTPLDGGHHARADVLPFEIDVTPIGRSPKNPSYRRIHGTKWRLEEWLYARSTDSSHVNSSYLLVNDGVSGTHFWVLDRDRYDAAELYGCVTPLRRELNHHEHQNAQAAHRALYEWVEEGEGKWRLRPEFRSWAAET